MAALLLPHNGQSASVRRPIRPFNIVQDFSRSASDQRHPRKGAGIEELSDGVASQRKRHFAQRRDRQDVGSRRLQFVRLRAFGPRGEQLKGFPFPRCAVNDGLAIRSKACRVNHAAAKSERMVDGQCGLHRTLQQKSSNRDAGDQGDGGGQCCDQHTLLRRRGYSDRSHYRRPRGARGDSAARA